MKKRTCILTILLLLIAAILLIIVFSFNGESTMPHEAKLYAQALIYHDEACAYYYDALKCDDNDKMSELCEKAVESCNKGMELLYQIEDYYISHGIDINEDAEWYKLLIDFHKLTYPINNSPPFVKK